MAFPNPPKTWGFQESVESSEMNAELRDALLLMDRHLIARKLSDQGFSSTTLADVTTMTLPVIANEVYRFEFQIIYSGPTAGDLKTAFTFPAAGRIDAGVVWLDDTGAVAAARYSGTTTPTTAVNFSGSATERQVISIQGIFTNAGTGGNLQLQAAQVAASGTSTIYTHSTVWAVKLA